MRDVTLVILNSLRIKCHIPRTLLVVFPREVLQTRRTIGAKSYIPRQLEFHPQSRFGTWNRHVYPANERIWRLGKNITYYTCFR